MPMRRLGRNFRTLSCLMVLGWGATAVAAFAVDAAQELGLKPGFNLFSKQQDIETGKEYSAEIDQQLPLLNDPETLRYINDLGKRLTQYEPLPADYPWTFKVVNTKDINAFALPGGFIYVNRGTIEVAENEAQLAGVIAHETGHVVMRHGTHQASQRLAAELPLAILGAMLGQSSDLTSQLTQMVVSVGVNSLFLHNSRTAESQADAVGTYVLYHAGYVPQAMAQFFAILEKKYPAAATQSPVAQFFSDHPNPGNRIQAVNAEVSQLGPPVQGKTDSPEFEVVKKRLLGMPAPPGKSEVIPAQSGGTIGRVSRAEVMPSGNFKNLVHDVFRISYPDNWQVFGDTSTAVTIAPRAGISENAVAYGVMINSFQPESGRAAGSLDDATHQLLDSLRQGNPDLKVIGHAEDIRVNQRPGKVVELTGPSPILDSTGHPMREHDWLVAVQRSDGSLLYMVCVSPEQDFQSFRPTFERMVQSLQMR